MGLTKEEALQRELDQARAGTHPRMAGEKNRLVSLTASRVRRAEQLREYRIGQVDAQFKQEKLQAEEEFGRERTALQDRLVQEVYERNRRQTKVPRPTSPHRFTPPLSGLCRIRLTPLHSLFAIADGSPGAARGHEEDAAASWRDGALPSRIAAQHANSHPS